MKRIFDHFWGLIGRMTPSQIVLAAITVVSIVVGTLLILNWAKSQYYVPLYSNLSSEEAGKILDKLNEMEVSYEIGDNGSSISVPSGDVHEARMKLATAGLPNAKNIGYALFDESNLGMTDFLQKVNYRRALEGELARTIAGLEEVSAARVHLVIPEERLFAEDQNPPSASVVLKLEAGRLTQRQLKGISYLVASAVEGMSPENVTLIDYGGNLLTSQSGGDPAAMMSSNQFEMRRNIENYLEQKAQSMLASVIGPGHAIVRVTAELDFEQTSTQIESYDPDNVAIRSEQRTTQKGSESENAPTAGTTQTQSSTVTDNLEDVITNYEVPRTVQSIIGEVGDISRLTVAVIVDGTYETTTTPEGVEETEYIARTQEDLNRFASIIKNAVGFSDARADNFEIVNVPFDNGLMVNAREELDTMGNLSTYLPYAKKIGTGILLLLAFFYLKKKVKRIFSAIAKYVPPPPPPQMSALEAEIQQKPQKPKLIDTMKTQVQGKNEEIAKVIKTMMAE